MGLKKNSNVQSGPKKCLNKKETEEIDFKHMTCTQTGVDLAGGDILSSYYIGGKDEKSCRFECQKNSDCLMFTLYNDVRTFYLCLDFSIVIMLFSILEMLFEIQMGGLQDR